MPDASGKIISSLTHVTRKKNATFTHSCHIVIEKTEAVTE
jgi:hypothetical protein